MRPKPKIQSARSEVQHPTGQSAASGLSSVAAATGYGRGTTDKPRYIMIGGFLGAGKTTALSRLARHLTGQGLRVGLITNDQGNQLVDTATLASQGFPVEEIPGGCFCCRFNSLIEAARKLSAETRPEAFIAEPVGSCTDLVATVSYPLRRLYGDAFTIAPLSVLVDPIRALRVFGLAEGGKFSDKVRYIYRKQLEEADLIVINKCDLLAAEQRNSLNTALEENFPTTRRFEISARKGIGLEEWFERLMTDSPSGRPAMALDYEVYAQGEALLGWLNATLDLNADVPFDGNGLLKELAANLQDRLARQGAEIAHLKLTLDPEVGLGDLGVINLVRNDYLPELSQELHDPVQGGQLILNLRAEVSPQVLRRALEEGLATWSAESGNVRMRLEHVECFQPGKPLPTHRLSVP
ncbi:MAG TPA: GTP-binding protein [Candidatus Binatia bacterium]|nr:GTP-binding protein [Candidatus Binatia bacterium]